MKKVIIISALILTSGLTAWAVSSNAGKTETAKVSTSATVNNTPSNAGNLATAD